MGDCLVFPARHHDTGHLLVTLALQVLQIAWSCELSVLVNVHLAKLL